jgi:hypothetical protein
MIQWIKYILDWLRTPAHYFLPVFAASCFALFAPLKVLEFLGVAFWRIEGKPYLGSAFVISTAVVFCHYSSKLIAWSLNQYHMFLSTRAAHARLKNLTPKEKMLLAGYLKEDTRTQKFWVENGVVAGLQHANIIYPAVSQADGDHFPFNIRPWVWDYLKKNPHLVGIKHDQTSKKP